MNLIIYFCSFHHFYASTAWKVKVRNQRKILGGCALSILSKEHQLDYGSSSLLFSWCVFINLTAKFCVSRHFFWSFPNHCLLLWASLCLCTCSTRGGVNYQMSFMLSFTVGFIRPCLFVILGML